MCILLRALGDLKLQGKGILKHLKIDLVISYCFLNLRKM